MLSLPMVAQDVQVKEPVKEEMVRQPHKKQMAMKNRKAMMHKRRQMNKKRAIRSVIRLVVIGGVAYYIGFTQGKKSGDTE